MKIFCIIFFQFFIFRIDSNSRRGGICHRTDKVITYVSSEVVLGKLGFQAQLYCCILNSEFLGWVFLDSRIDSNSKYALTFEKNINAQILSINNVQESDSGTYFCRVKQSSNDIRDFPILLNIKAELTNTNAKHYLEISKNARIPLNIVGIPFPTVHFLKTDLEKVLVENFISGQSARAGRYEITSDGDIVIHNLEQADSGRYIIRLSQHSGQQIEDFLIEIFAGARPFVAYVPNKSYNFTLGQDELLPARFSGELLNIYWKFTSDITGQTADRIIGDTHSHYFVSVDGSLTVKGVVTSDSGIYIGVCSNPWGEVQVKTSVIQTIRTPKILILNGENADVGSNATLKVKVDGNPPPYISWWRNGVQLKSVRINNFESELRLTRITQNDGGIYTCIVDNGATLNGVRNYISQNVTLAVKSFPTIDVPQSSEIVFVTANRKFIQLVCVVVGYPPSTITFFKGDTVFTPNPIRLNQKFSNQLEAFLTITVQNNDQIGNYTCMATNSLGTVTHNIVVKYIDGPSPPKNVHVVQVDPFSVRIVWDISETSSDVRKTYSFLPLVWSPDKTFTMSKNVSQLFVVFNGLIRGKTYYFSVRALNIAGWSTPSQVISFSTPNIGKPSPPQILNREIFLKSSEIRLYWDSPIDNGGDADLTYNIKMCLWDLNKFFMNTDCEYYNDIRSNEIYFSGLVSFQYYDFYITANNRVERSDFARFQVFTGQNTIIGSPGPTSPEVIAVWMIFGTFLFILLIDLLLWIFFGCGILRWFLLACLWKRMDYDDEQIPLRQDSMVSGKRKQPPIQYTVQPESLYIPQKNDYLLIEDQIYQEQKEVSLPKSQLMSKEFSEDKVFRSVSDNAANKDAPIPSQNIPSGIKQRSKVESTAPSLMQSSYYQSNNQDKSYNSQGLSRNLDADQAITGRERSSGQRNKKQSEVEVEYNSTPPKLSKELSRNINPNYTTASIIVPDPTISEKYKMVRSLPVSNGQRGQGFNYSTGDAEDDIRAQYLTSTVQNPIVKGKVKTKKTTELIEDDKNKKKIGEKFNESYQGDVDKDMII